MSVRELVKKKEQDIIDEQKKHERRERDRKRRAKNKAYHEEVKWIIATFEHRFFNLESSEDEVAEAVMSANNKEYNFLCGSDVQFGGVEFNVEDAHKYSPYSSYEFKQWHDKIKEKFGVMVVFYEITSSNDRYGSSGHLVWSDDIYEGIGVKFRFV